MTRSTYRPLPLLTLLLIGAPVPMAVLAAPTQVQDFDVSEVVRDTDWSRSGREVIEFDGRRYIGSVTRLQRGQPYRLELNNIGDRPTNLLAPELMRTSAVANLRVAGASLSSPHFGEVTLAPGTTLFIDLLPTEPGNFQLQIRPDGEAQQEIIYRVEVVDSPPPRKEWRLRR